MLITGIITKVLIRTITSNKEIFTRLIIGILIYSTILSYQTYGISFHFETQILGGLFHTNNLINGMEMYIYILSILLIIFIVGKEELIAEYRIILSFSILGMITLIESYDLISTFLAIELQSLSMYIIATISRKEATAAGLKYFLLGSLSSAIFLLGLVLIYSLTGITQYDGYNIINSINNQISNQITDFSNNNPFVRVGRYEEGGGGIPAEWGVVNYSGWGFPLSGGLVEEEGNSVWSKICILGIIFITIGLLFKIGAAPFHNWAPDVYDNIPTLVTSWVATMGKISILLFILIIKSTGDFGWILESLTILIISAILSLIIGSILGLVQYRIKRLLAYSSISHLGYMLIGLSIDNGLAFSSFLFYMFQYWLSLICIFAIILFYSSYGSPFGKWNSFQSISSLRLLSINPTLIIALIINLFSLTGIPPLLGFFGKQMILYVSLINGYYLISTIAICTSVISAAFYLRIIKTISFTFFPHSDPSRGKKNTSENNNKIGTTNFININNKLPLRGIYLGNIRPLSWIISIITLITLLFFINPTIILNLTHSFAIWNLL